MIPEAKTLAQRLASTQFCVITERGRTTPYTFDRLYGVPEEHTTNGLGRKFQKYLDGLTAQGKELTLWNVAIFFKWVMVKHVGWLFLAHESELPLALLINLNLMWLNSRKDDVEAYRGLGIFCSILVVSFMRVFGCFQLDLVGESNALRYINALGVLFYFIFLF